MSKIESFKDLIVYQKAYTLAMEIFEISKFFPKKKNILLPTRCVVLHDQ